MGEKKNHKAFIMRADGKTYDSLEEVFAEVLGLTPEDDNECDGDCEKCQTAERDRNLKEMADEAYAIYTAFQQAGFSPEQAFELLLAGLE